MSMSRRWLGRAIIAGLLVIGITGVLLRVRWDVSYTAQLAFADVLIEALPAALLFLLIDGAVLGSARRDSVRQQLVRRMRADVEGAATQALQQLAQGHRLVVNDLTRVELQHAKAVGLNIGRGSFAHADLSGMALTNCAIKNVRFDHAVLESCSFENSQFHDASFVATELVGTIFLNCHFDHRTTFIDADLSGTRFVKCRFEPGVAESITSSGAFFIECSGIAAGTLRRLREAGVVVREDSP